LLRYSNIALCGVFSPTSQSAGRPCHPPIGGDKYIQHNPQIGDGLSGLGKALEALAKAGITMKYDKVHKVLGEGNFVLAASEGTFGGKHTAYFDLFRVENGKIAEHWDTMEAIPDKKEWKNGNGKF
jgi:predicted SnoaL-like aldol condensation-catalyzing enzyme